VSRKLLYIRLKIIDRQKPTGARIKKFFFFLALTSPWDYECVAGAQQTDDHKQFPHLFSGTIKIRKAKTVPVFI